MVAAERLAAYDEALAHLPGFAVKPLEQAATGEYRFMDRRGWP
ncbi:hypothetical protein ACFYQ5_08280 [Streptomyces sp. NPDC005794]